MSGTQPARSNKTYQPRKSSSRQGSSDGSRRNRAQRAREQQHARERQADQARQKVHKRRNKQSGVAGWVSDRASQWSLEGPDWEFFELQKYFWNPLMDYWFRMEIEGWDRLPEPPALLIGIHSGPRSCGTRGRSECSGGGASGATGRCTERLTMR